MCVDCQDERDVPRSWNPSWRVSAGMSIQNPCLRRLEDLHGSIGLGEAGRQQGALSFNAGGLGMVIAPDMAVAAYSAARTTA